MAECYFGQIYLSWSVQHRIAHVCMDACATSTFSSPIEMYGTQTFDEVFKQGLFFLNYPWHNYYGSIHAMKKNQEVVQLTSSDLMCKLHTKLCLFPPQLQYLEFSPEKLLTISMRSFMLEGNGLYVVICQYVFVCDV